MVQALPPLLEELRNRRIRHRGLDQFDAALTHRNHRYAYLLGFDDLFGHHGQPEFFVELFGFGQRLHGDSQMIDLRHACFPSSPTISSTSEYGSRLCSATSVAMRSA